MTKRFSDVIRNIREVKEPTGKLKDACRKDYTAIGMKEKNGRKVPNCVPVGEQFASDKPEQDREAVGGRFTSAPAKTVQKPSPQATPKNEEVEQIEEMPGANMDTRAVHKHLRKSGWSLTRTKGSHDVYTHPKSEKNIAVPRHKQLKAPLVRGIMKDAQVSEEVEHVTESRGHKILATKLAQIAARKHREREAAKRESDKQGVAEVKTKATMAEATIMKNILGGRWFDDYHEIPGYWDKKRSGNYVWTELDLESFGFEYTGRIGGLKYLGIKSLKRPTKQEIRQWLNANIKMLARNGFKPIQQGVAEAKSPDEFIQGIRKMARSKPSFQVGDWVEIDPNKTAGWASSGLIGRIDKIYTNDDGKKIATINVNPRMGAHGTQTKMKLKGGMLGPKGSTLDLGRGVRMGGTHTSVPTSMIMKVDMTEDQQGVAEGLNESAIFLNPNTVIVGQDHRKPLDLSPETLKRIQEIAKKHGAWYEGDGGDTKYTKDVIDNYVGSFDDEIAKTINPNDPKWLFVLFSNVDENNTVQRVGVDPNDTIFNRLLATDKVNSYQNIGFTEQALKKFLSMCSEDDYDFVKMSQQPATQKNVTKFLKAGENLMWPSNWEQYPNRAGKVAKSVDERDQYLAKRKSGVYVVGSGHIKAIQQILGKQDVVESSDNSGNSKGSWKVETPWRKMESPVVVDKSGAKHTPMSRVKHLAKMAARKKVTEQNDDIQTPAKKSLAFRGVVKNTEKPTKGKKIDSDEKFEAEPELNTQIMRNM